MCGIMEKRIRESRIECARKAIEDEEFTNEQIAKILNLPLSTVRKLAAAKAGFLSETEDKKPSGIRC